ncbi:MAG: tetratricopeptide repeat protein [Arenimonas sp.]
MSNLAIIRAYGLHYAEGMAALRTQKPDETAKHLEALLKLAADPAMEKLTVWDRYPLLHAVNIAKLNLFAEIVASNDDKVGAIKTMREAVAIEDRIPYDEPPGWHAPTRHSLGVFLLDDGKAVEAEKVYREELARNPENGWSLFGLAQSLRAQKRDTDAAEVDKRFIEAWKNADVKLTASRF